MSAESALAAEQAHKRLSMTGRAYYATSFKMVSDNHFKPWQLKVLEHLDVSDSRLGTDTTVLLAKKLEAECHLVTFNAADHMSESGCCALLESMGRGGATESLTFFDLTTIGSLWWMIALEILAHSTSNSAELAQQPHRYRLSPAQVPASGSTFSIGESEIS